MPTTEPDSDAAWLERTLAKFDAADLYRAGEVLAAVAADADRRRGVV